MQEPLRAIQFTSRRRGCRYCAATAMSAPGQERRIGATCNISALPPRADVGADIVEPPLRAISGREQMQQTANYSITSSAMASSDAGISRSSALAVLRLMSSSNRAGCSTGRSAGFAPFRILST